MRRASGRYSNIALILSQSWPSTYKIMLLDTMMPPNGCSRMDRMGPMGLLCFCHCLRLPSSELALQTRFLIHARERDLARDCAGA